MRNSLPTTIDNEFNPWLEWENWLHFDLVNQYNTYQNLVEFGHFSEESSELDEDEERERAIDTLIELFPMTYTRWYEGATEKGGEGV